MSNTARHDYDKRVIRTKKAIKAALFKIMENKDISAITISELTAEANVNRRTFYTHYRNLTDILNEIEGDLVAALKELVDKFDENEFEKSTYDLFLGLDRLITVDFDYYFHLVRVGMRGMLMSRLKNVIKISADSLIGSLSHKPGSDAAIVSAFIVGGFFNTYLEWHNNPGDMPIERHAQLAAAMVGLCAKNAQKVASELK